MPSIIEGYNYDIFISYRQKDNKGNKWVSEFVDALKTELESTFKEEVSVYFDINPHDGLLETHDVDASLKEKLKCLVFIPIISRTYCDPKSFAWGHEFKVFIEQASQDKFGLKVKLPNGNVANRVLPVRIHDLDNDDVKLCESVLGGVLRGVEFIYKEPGVDKPLAPEDNEKGNLNNTKYRIQIIKVANAIKEIISGLKTESISVVKEEDQPEEPFKTVREDERKKEAKKPVKSFKRRWLPVAAIAALLLIAAIIAYPKIFKQDRLEKLRSSGERISVVVMPFQNMTNDTIWNVWQDGIQNDLITYLSDNPEELIVRQIESTTGLLQSKGLTNYASLTPSIASRVSKKLNASVFIYGSINQAGSLLRLNARLIDSKTEETLKSFQIEWPYKEENIFPIIDSLSVGVKDFLIISKLKKELNPKFRSLAFTSTTSPEAYRYFIYGEKAFIKMDWPTAIKLYSQAVEIDSNYNYATIRLSVAYLNQGLYIEAKRWCIKVYKNRNQMPMQLKIWTDRLYAICFETPYEQIKYIKQLQEIDDQWPLINFPLGVIYDDLQQYDNAISKYEKALEIGKKWGLRFWIYNYTYLGKCYHKTGQYKKEKKLYKKAEQNFPDNPDLLYRQIILTLTEGDTIGANKYIDKYISICNDNAIPEVNIKTQLAGIYSEANILDKSEENYQQAIILEPENPHRLNDLAFFLIDKDRKINEGMKLIEKVLESNSENYVFLDTKGWGLYKQGKYQEALEILQKSWNIRREQAIYDHEAFLHLEAAKRAVASQKNN